MGSSSLGNISVPQIDHTAAAVTIPVKASTAFCTYASVDFCCVARGKLTLELRALSIGVGIMIEGVALLDIEV